MTEIFENTQFNTADNEAIAYVDGSYNAADSRFSYGVVLFAGEKEIHMSRAFSHDELAKMRNVAGEIMGSAQAMKLSREAGIKKLTIYHDYEGIAKWPLRQWKAKKTWTQKYRDFYDEVSKDVEIHFIKVAGHSGDKYNDLADKLAKEALGI